MSLVRFPFMSTPRGGVDYAGSKVTGGCGSDTAAALAFVGERAGARYHERWTHLRRQARLADQAVSDGLEQLPPPTEPDTFEDDDVFVFEGFKAPSTDDREYLRCQ